MYLKILECYQGENIIANRPSSTHILYHFNIYNFSLKWHNLITFKGNSHCRFRITLGIPLTMPSKKWIWDCWPLKICTGHNIENLSDHYLCKQWEYVIWVKSCKYWNCMEYRLTNDGWLWYSLPDNTLESSDTHFDMTMLLWGVFWGGFFN